MKVFALYEGNVWEGGGVQEIYAEVENAIKFAIMKVDIRQKEWDVVFHDTPTMIAKRWVPLDCGGDIIKRWSNTHDEIMVIAYELK